MTDQINAQLASRSRPSDEAPEKTQAKSKKHY